MPLWRKRAKLVSMAVHHVKQPTRSPLILRTTPSRVSQPYLGQELGLKKMDVSSLIRLLSEGLPWSAVTSFVKNTGFSLVDLARYLGIPERTFARRREAGMLEPSESERLIRLAEIYASSQQLFDGDRDAARQWLTSPIKGLGSARPIDYAQTELGAREVRNLIGRLEHGIFS
jgi:putative toxin-antitoxin system antitoxin component (TIGR02293 family)